MGSSCMGNIPLPFTNLFEIDSSGLAMKRLGSNFAVIDKVLVHTHLPSYHKIKVPPPNVDLWSSLLQDTKTSLGLDM